MINKSYYHFDLSASNVKVDERQIVCLYLAWSLDCLECAASLCKQEEVLPSVGQAAPESDSDSGVGSPAEEQLTETSANKKEELQGEVAFQCSIIQPEFSLYNYRIVAFML